MLHERKPSRKLEYGTDEPRPGQKAEGFALWIALWAALFAVGGVLSAIALFGQLLVLAMILSGIVLVIGAYIGPQFSAWHGVGGVALIVAGFGLHWLLRRLELDE